MNRDLKIRNMTLYWSDIASICILIGAIFAEFSLKRDHLNKKINKTEIGILSPTTLHDCIRKCKRNDNCKSINFNRDDGTCWLYGFESTDSGVSFTDSLGLLFSDMGIWPAVPGDRCLNQTCERGRCMSAGTTHVCKVFEKCDRLAVDGVDVNDTATSVGTFLKVTCKEIAQTLKGNSVIECKDTGLWSDKPVCQ